MLNVFMTSLILGNKNTPTLGAGDYPALNLNSILFYFKSARKSEFLGFHDRSL